MGVDDYWGFLRMLAAHPSAIMSLESRGWKSSLPRLGLVSLAWCVSLSPELSVQPGDGISSILTTKGWWCVCIVMTDLCCCMAETKKALQSKFTHETNLHIHQLKYQNKKVMLQSRREYL